MICEACKRKQTAAVNGNGWKAYHGKSEHVLSDLADGSVGAVITDPPYGTGANGVTARTASTSTKYRTTGAAELPEFAGDSLLPEAWSAMMSKVWRECYRVCGEGAVVLAFCDWRAFHPMLTQITSVGFKSRGVVVWNKGRGARPTKNGFRAQSEFIIYASKGKLRERPNPFYGDGVINCTTKVNNKRHTTEKPLQLMAELIKCAAPGALIVDPFQGSGTTGEAAIAAGYEFIGIEETEAYHKIATERLRNAER
ncbi:DNA adenine methyltransferase YhdJ [Allorhodopirellula heiligendammensis]|uniref:Methyltransferase n=2 Tax=Allorhodopirellula heiligendammensis TaxID=2714739 RepID=A0A5C6C4M1_9BACT|nr:DNA adenine methyltransferase YhdJ [Allorhodopirellula heiligendammensis]